MENRSQSLLTYQPTSIVIPHQTPCHMKNPLIFSTRTDFRQWLTTNGATSDGIWLLFRKKGEPATLTANDALEEALCHGWIDGQVQSIDENSYQKYFSRRRAISNWSEKNKKLAQTLIEKGMMTQQGMEAIESAKKNGMWENSFRTTIDEQQIEQFRQLIQPYPSAYSNLLAMSPSVQRTYTALYLDAKTENTRQTRLAKIIDRLTHNLKPM